MSTSHRPDFIIKEDSVTPTLEYRLTERTSASVRRSPVDLTDANTVTFLMPISEEGMIQDTASIDDAEDGQVVVELPSGIEDGDYDAEFRVDWENSEKAFYPQARNLLIAVRAGTDRELDPADLSDPDASVTTLFATTVQTDELIINDTAED